MKVTNTYANINIESAISRQDIRNIKRYNPAALDLKDAKGKILFAVDYMPLSGCATGKCLAFDQITADDKLLLTINEMGLASMPAADRKKFIKDQYGMILANLEKVEAQVTNALVEVNATIESVDSKITCA